MSNFEKLDDIALLTSFISVANYIENLKQTSNDDLMKELKENADKKLMVIIDQNNEIIKLLKENKNGSK